MSQLLVELPALSWVVYAGQHRDLMSKHVAMQKRLVDEVPYDAAPYGLR